MKKVCENVAQYDEEITKAIPWIEHVRGNSGVKDHASSYKDESNDDGNDLFENESTETSHVREGHNGNQFFDDMGWYSGFFKNIKDSDTGPMYTTKFDKDDVYQWTQDDFDKYTREDAEIGEMGWQFFERFADIKGKSVVTIIPGWLL